MELKVASIEIQYTNSDGSIYSEFINFNPMVAEIITLFKQEL